MNIFRIPKLLLLTLSFGLALLSGRGVADDIDIFTGASGGSAAAPNVMILLDNMNDWYNDNPNSKWRITGLLSVLDTFTTPINVGLAEFSYNSPSGAYIRFAPRDMSNTTNRTALKNLINAFTADSRHSIETGNQKDESAGFYEIYQYFNGLTPRAGTLSQNSPADATSNTGPYTGSTAFGQGLTSGFAFKSDGTYNFTPSASCGPNYIIYITANNGASSASDSRSYTTAGITTTATAELTPKPGSDTWADEWANYLYTQKNIVTYVLDQYFPDDNQDAAYSSNLQAIGKQGGGGYTHVRNQTDVTNTLLRIFAEIQAVNSTFSSASLPVNTTNRTQDKNQVFIPMFRPDSTAKPRWMGNLKKYQLIKVGTDVQLGDSAGNSAVNTTSGFLKDCATSFWTSDSGTYWKNVPEIPSPKGICSTTSYDPFSDSPDGPIVEKGGTAEVVRKGNNPTATDTTPTWAVNRTLYTQSGTSLTAFNTTSSGLTASLVDFTSGKDVNDENGNSNTTETRPSLHGDTIHSRPLPIDYGGTTDVVTYYGANDGTFRAVNSTNGKELWAFIAPESFSKLQRLNDNSPLINYPNMPSGVTPTPTAKDYFFDGSTGVYQTTGNSSVWIYPTMRRGGRMIYALDVTTPASPTFKWKVGCPNLTNDTSCTSGFSGLGQTWSMPNVTANVSGYTGPVVIVGGGYDACEDANTSSPSCSTPKGAGVYVLNADTGAVVKSFSTTRSVAADVALIATGSPGVVDHAYAVDTGGNIYRIDFKSTGASDWVINRVAYTNGSGRKFLFAPALLSTGGKVYVTLGSGDREHPLQSQYPYSGVTNRFYVYLDDLSATTANNLDDTTNMTDFTTASTCSTSGVFPNSTQKGWFMNLNQNGTGEQTVTSAVIAAGMVTFSTNRPIPAASGTCSTTLGEARGYWVNLFNGSGAIGVSGTCGGTRSSTFVGGGLPPSPVMGTVPVGGTTMTVILGAAQRSGAASTPISPQQIKPAITQKRKVIYWKSSGVN